MFLYHGYRNQGAGRGTRLREGCTTAGAKAIEAQVSITGVVFSFIGNTPKRYQCFSYCCNMHRFKSEDARGRGNSKLNVLMI
jgi:hypothetical protein